jgi:hypothetical protein
MTIDPLPPRRLADHWLNAATVVALSAILAVVGWTAMQLVAMRDDIHTLKDAIPALQSRMDRLERHQDLVDGYIFRVEGAGAA